jgi:hypothetical protein
MVRTSPSISLFYTTNLTFTFFDSDLKSALQEATGDVELAAARISEGLSSFFYTSLILSPFVSQLAPPSQPRLEN